MAATWLLFSVILVLMRSIHAQIESYFINPPQAGPTETYSGNPRLALNEKIQVAWVTTLDSYTIDLWQQSLGMGVAVKGPTIFSKLHYPTRRATPY